jgi:N4-gp56 family major capsid protein
MPTTAATVQSTVASDQAAYEQKAYYALRQQYFFDRCATVKPTMETHSGSSVVFNILTEAAVATTALTENVDNTPVALTDGTTSVTIAEYGNSTTISNLLRGTSYLNEMVRASTEIGENAGKSQDTLARDPLLAGSNVIFPSAWGGTGTTRATIAATDVITADAVRQAKAQLANNSAKRFSGMGGYYSSFIAPDVVYDLTSETGADAWREPRVQAGVSASDVFMGVVGYFEGFNFQETPRLDVAELTASDWVNAGASNVDAYPTLFLGQEALAKAYAKPVSAPMAQIVISPTTDNLKRFKGVGWLWVGGYARFREACLVRVESSSSIGAN